MQPVEISVNLRSVYSDYGIYWGQCYSLWTLKPIIIGKTGFM